MPWWWFDLFWCHEVGCGVRWSNLVVCEVTWCTLNVVSCDVSCHVMSRTSDVAVMSTDVMRFFLCCVTSRHAMFCHVMRCHAIPYLKWNVQHNARSNSFTCVWGHWIWFAAMFPWHHTSHITTPNTAPATQNEPHDWSASHMKRHLECAEDTKSTSNLTKYCACHAKWIWWLIRVTYETSFRMRIASKVNLETHQIVHLPRKMNLMIDPPHIWNVI